MAFSLPNKQSQTMSNIKIENSIITSIVTCTNGHSKVFVKNIHTRDTAVFHVISKSRLLDSFFSSMNARDIITIELRRDDKNVGCFIIEALSKNGTFSPVKKPPIKLTGQQISSIKSAWNKAKKARERAELNEKILEQLFIQETGVAGNIEHSQGEGFCFTPNDCKDGRMSMDCFFELVKAGANLDRIMRPLDL